MADDTVGACRSRDANHGLCRTKMATPIRQSGCGLCGLPAYRTISELSPARNIFVSLDSFDRLISGRPRTMFANLALHLHTLQRAMKRHLSGNFFLPVIVSRNKYSRCFDQSRPPGPVGIRTSIAKAFAQ